MDAVQSGDECQLCDVALIAECSDHLDWLLFSFADGLIKEGHTSRPGVPSGFRPDTTWDSVLCQHG